MEDWPFSFKDYWGDERTRQHVEFSREGKHFCIYCGAESDSREHCPSRVFLTKPYPEGLPVLPACTECNNSFSEDESYVALYIDSLMYLSGVCSELPPRMRKRGLKSNSFRQAKNDWEEYQSTKILPQNKRIIRILSKLAIGHMVYELSEGYKEYSCYTKPISVEYRFSFQMKESEINEYDGFVFMFDKKLPELGSRVFDRIFVLEQVLRSHSSQTSITVPMLVMNWNDIQEGNYSYIAWYDNDSYFHVKIIIRNFLFAHLVFSQEDTLDS